MKETQTLAALQLIQFLQAETILQPSVPCRSTITKINWGSSIPKSIRRVYIWWGLYFHLKYYQTTH